MQLLPRRDHLQLHPRAEGVPGQVHVVLTRHSEETHSGGGDEGVQGQEEPTGGRWRDDAHLEDLQRQRVLPAVELSLLQGLLPLGGALQGAEF